MRVPSGMPIGLCVGVGGRWGLLVARRHCATVYMPSRNQDRLALCPTGGLCVAGTLNGSSCKLQLLKRKGHIDHGNSNLRKKRHESKPRAQYLCVETHKLHWQVTAPKFTTLFCAVQEPPHGPDGTSRTPKVAKRAALAKLLVIDSCGVVSKAVHAVGPTLSSPGTGMTNVGLLSRSGTDSPYRSHTH
jgi:hypothetical protein